jgi:hypothetical protein
LSFVFFFDSSIFVYWNVEMAWYMASGTQSQSAKHPTLIIAGFHFDHLFHPVLRFLRITSFSVTWWLGVLVGRRRNRGSEKTRTRYFSFRWICRVIKDPCGHRRTSRGRSFWIANIRSFILMNSLNEKFNVRCSICFHFPEIGAVFFCSVFQFQQDLFFPNSRRKKTVVIPCFLHKKSASHTMCKAQQVLDELVKTKVFMWEVGIDHFKLLPSFSLPNLSFSQCQKVLKMLSDSPTQSALFHPK